jgi:hypothetical protein
MKDKDYDFDKVYQQEFKSVQITLTPNTLPADGSSQSTVVCQISSSNPRDSLNLSLLNLSLTTSDGSFQPGSSQTVTLTPLYSLDASGKRVISAKTILQSSTSVDTAKLRLTYLSIEKDTFVVFTPSYPSSIKMTASSLNIHPDFSTNDTITVQLSSATGTASAGSPVQLVALDASFQDTLGLYRISSTKTNATGTAYFVFVLGDKTINKTDYVGPVNFVCTTNNGTTNFSKTLTIYSTN